MKCLFHTAIWGKEYVYNFLRLSLPTLLAKGNIEKSDWATDSLFMIFTTYECKEQLVSSPIFSTLSDRIEVQIVLIDKVVKSGKFDTLNSCQIEGLVRSREFEAIFFVYPDFIWSAGSIERVIDKLKEGYKGFLCPVPRVELDTFSPALTRLIRKDGDSEGALTLPPREFVKICDRHFHSIMETYELDGELFSNFPSQLSWKIPGEGRLYHCFHVHPIALLVDKRNMEFLTRITVTLDEDYISSLFISTNLLHLSNDSDEIAVCSLTPASFDILSEAQFGTDRFVAIWRWSERYASTLHRSMVKKPYRWHWKEVDPKKWNEFEVKAEKLILSLGAQLSMPDSIAKKVDKSAFSNRQIRLSHLSRRRKYGSAQLRLFEPINEFQKLAPLHIKFKHKFIDIVRNVMQSRIFEYQPFYSIRSSIRSILLMVPYFSKLQKYASKYEKEFRSDPWSKL